MVMVRFHICIVSVVAVVIGMAVGQAGPARGEDFRVENAVYAGDQKEPSIQSTTIFCDGVVYDCMKTPAETVVFDKAASRFVLLNLTHQTRTQLTTGEVAAFIDRLQSLAAKSKDPLAEFLAGPKFQERFDESAGELILRSPLLSYRLVLAPEPSQEVVEQYHEFRDWYARLNTLLVPGSMPPFGQLVVNAAVAQRQATPSQVVRTIVAAKGLKRQQTTIRSEHRLVRPLDPADIEQVAQTRELMGSFRLVSFDEYRKIEPR